MRMEISLPLCHSPSVSLPPAVMKSKKFEVLSFILFRCWTVPGSQAIKHTVTAHHHFSLSVLFFRALHHYFASLSIPPLLQVSVIDPLPTDDIQILSFSAEYSIWCTYRIYIYVYCIVWCSRGRQWTVITWRPVWKCGAVKHDIVLEATVVQQQMESTQLPNI